MVAAFAGAFFGCVWAVRSCNGLGNYREALRAAARPFPGVRSEWMGQSAEDYVRGRGENPGDAIEGE